MAVYISCQNKETSFDKTVCVFQTIWTFIWEIWEDVLHELIRIPDFYARIPNKKCSSIRHTIFMYTQHWFWTKKNQTPISFHRCIETRCCWCFTRKRRAAWCFGRLVVVDEKPACVLHVAVLMLHFCPVSGLNRFTYWRPVIYVYVSATCMSSFTCVKLYLFYVSATSISNLTCVKCCLLCYIEYCFSLPVYSLCVVIFVSGVSSLTYLAIRTLF